MSTLTLILLAWQLDAPSLAYRVATPEDDCHELSYVDSEGECSTIEDIWRDVEGDVVFETLDRPIQ